MSLGLGKYIPTRRTTFDRDMVRNNYDAPFRQRPDRRNAYPSDLFINLLGVSVGAMLKDKFCVKSKGRELIGPLCSAIIVAFSVA